MEMHFPKALPKKVARRVSISGYQWIIDGFGVQILDLLRAQRPRSCGVREILSGAAALCGEDLIDNVCFDFCHEIV